MRDEAVRLKGSDFRPNIGQFANRVGKQAQLHAFDKFTLRAFATNPRNLAAELDFYEDRDTGIEQALGKLETLFSPAVDRLLVAGTCNELAIDDRASIAAFVAAQQVRTRESREQFRDLTQLLAKRLAEMDVDVDGVDWLSSLTSEDELRAAHVDQLRHTAPQLAGVIVQMKWVLLVNNSSMPFWTSDHPVTLYNPVPAAPLLGNLGWGVRGIQASFPLSPTRALSISDPNMYAALPGVIVSDDVNHAIHNNHLQMRYSTRYLFACNGNFRFAEKVLAAEPALRQLRRPRVTFV